MSTDEVLPWPGPELEAPVTWNEVCIDFDHSFVNKDHPDYPDMLTSFTNRNRRIQNQRYEMTRLANSPVPVVEAFEEVDVLDKARAWWKCLVAHRYPSVHTEDYAFALCDYFEALVALKAEVDQKKQPLKRKQFWPSATFSAPETITPLLSANQEELA